MFRVAQDCANEQRNRWCWSHLRSMRIVRSPCGPCRRFEIPDLLIVGRMKVNDIVFDVCSFTSANIGSQLC